MRQWRDNSLSMKHFSRSLVWLTASEIIFNVAGYVIHSALGRMLTPDDYGRYGIVVTLTTMIVILIGNGIPTAMTKHLSAVIARDPARIRGIKRKTIRMQATLMTAVTAVFFLAAPLLSRALGDPSLTSLFRVSSLIIPAFATASFYFSFFTGLQMFRLQAILKTVRALSRIALIITLAYFFGVRGAVSGYIIAPLVVFCTALVCDATITKKYFPAIADATIPSSDAPAFSTRAIFSFAWPLTMFLLFYELICTIDLYFVKGLLHDDTLTGLYNAAITAGRIPYFLFYALTIILLPAIAKTTAERDTRQTAHLLTSSLRLMVLVLVPLVTVLALYSEPTLRLIYGNAYIAAAPAMRIYVVGAGFLTVFYILSFALSGAGLVRLPMRLAGYGLVTLAALNVMLIPRYELIGAAVAMTIVAAPLMAGMLYSVRRHFAVSITARMWGASLAGVGIIVVLSRVLPSHALWFVISGGALTIAYAGVLALCGVLTKNDIQALIPARAKNGAR